MDMKRITPQRAVDPFNRITEMQRDLASLLTVNWSDVNPEITASVLRHAAEEIVCNLPGIVAKDVDDDDDDYAS